MNADGSPSLSHWLPGSDVPEFGSDEVRVWLVDLDSGVSPDHVELAEPGHELDLLNDVEKERSARFVRARDRRRFARGRAALRQILGAVVGRPPRSLLFRAVGHGKPVLDFGAMGFDENDRLTRVCFNVSHSSELALIAVCQGREIGVDIERIRPINEADRIVASYFSPSEQSEFTTLVNAVKEHVFFRGWTRKEAVLKGLGVGLAGLAARYETGFGANELPARFIPAAPAPQIKEWRLWEAAPRIGFVATVAVHFPAEC